MFRSKGNIIMAIRGFFVVFSLAFSLLGGCGVFQVARSYEKELVILEASQVENKVLLEVLVSYFKRESMHDDFADGTSKSYDLMVLEVMEPARYKGLELQVANESNSEVRSAEMAMGKRYIVEIDESLMDMVTKMGNPVGGASSSELYISPSEIRVVSEGLD